MVIHKPPFGELTTLPICDTITFNLYPMKTAIHSNFITASNLVWGTVGLGILAAFFSDRVIKTEKDILLTVISFVMLVVLGYFIRQGQSWAKYLFVGLTIIGLLAIPTYISNLSQEPVTGIIFILQAILQVWAVVLLFQIPKIAKPNLMDGQPVEEISGS